MSKLSSSHPGWVKEPGTNGSSSEKEREFNDSQNVNRYIYGKKIYGRSLFNKAQHHSRTECSIECWRSNTPRSGRLRNDHRFINNIPLSSNRHTALHSTTPGEMSREKCDGSLRWAIPSISISMQSDQKRWWKQSVDTNYGYDYLSLRRLRLQYRHFTSMKSRRKSIFIISFMKITEIWRFCNKAKQQQQQRKKRWKRKRWSIPPDAFRS